MLVLAATAAVGVLSLAQGSPAASAAGAVLIGNQVVESHIDSDGAGVAEAFQATAAGSGAASDVFVFVDGTPPARLTAGLYADAGGHPGALLAQGTLAAPTGAAWNDVSLEGTASLAAGTTYWIAILSPAGGGLLKFRDRRISGASETSLTSTLGSLPATWSTGIRYTDAYLSAYAVLAPPDTSAPSQPSSFAVTAASASSVSTSWTASTDDVGVSDYTLYLDGAQKDSTTATSYTFSGLACGTTHTGGVEARDASGNVSARSTLTFTAGACPDTSPPSQPSSFAVTAASASSVSTSWTASTDNVGVSDYVLSLDGVETGATSATSYTFSGLACGTSHIAVVEAWDASGNVSTPSTLTFTAGACPDTVTPTASLTVPVAGATVSGTVTVAAAAFDLGGVKSVQFKLDGSNLGTADTSLPYQVSWDTTAVADGSHTLAAVATDLAGNTGTATETVTVDNIPPPSISVTKVFEGSDTDRITHTFRLTAAVPIGHTLVLTHVSTIDATDGTGGIVTPGGVSDQGGNAWSQAAVSHPGLSFETVEVWTALVTSPLPSGAVVTVKGYSRGLSDEIAIFDVTGLAANPVDQKAASAGYLLTPATPYITPTQRHVLLVAVHGQSSAGAPWWTPEAATPAWSNVVDRFDGGNIARGIAVDVREVTTLGAYRSAGTVTSPATSNNLIVALRAAG